MDTTAKEKRKKVFGTYLYKNGTETKMTVPQPQKLSAIGKWLNDPQSLPLLEIVDMRAVLK